jgi:uncharacterized protein YPO0396
VRNRFTFDCAEWDISTEELIRTHSNAGDNSGGEQEKLMAFCLAGALSFNLASPESADNRPVFAQLMLDEAFSKSDPQFAQQALQAFRKFGFQLVIDQDDLRVHVTAPRDALEDGTGTGGSVMSRSQPPTWPQNSLVPLDS